MESGCIAGCERAPSMMVNDKYHEPMDEKALDCLLDGSPGSLTVESLCSAASESPTRVRSTATPPDGGYTRPAQSLTTG